MPPISSVPRLENQDTPPRAPYLALVPDGAGHVDFLYAAGGTDTQIASLVCGAGGTFTLEIADAAIIAPDHRGNRWVECADADVDRHLAEVLATMAVE